MFRTLLFLYAESPVHAGADTSLGAVDLPIQREAGTGLPVIWGQSLKGALRSHFREVWNGTGDDDIKIEDVFGSSPPSPPDDTPAEDDDRTDNKTVGASGGGDRGTRAGDDGRRAARRKPGPVSPGSLAVGDAQMVAFPAPTARAMFAWVSGAVPLGRLRRKAELAGVGGAPAHCPNPAGATVFAADGGWAERTVVGPFVVTPQADDLTGRWARFLAEQALPTTTVPAYFADKLKRDLLVVPDQELAAVTRECADITPRVQLSESEKTVKFGPFYSEYLPCETLLAALLECQKADHLDRMRKALDEKVLRLGGNETIGKGLLWCRFVGTRAVGGRDGGAAAGRDRSAVALAGGGRRG
jgi:CRISPR-associated protein Cmr4